MSDGQPITVSQAIAIALDHHRAGRVAEAENIYRQVLAADPQNFDARHLLGTAMLQLRRPDEAVDHLMAALAIRPESPYTYNNLGEACRALDDLDGARAAFETAIAQKADCFEAHNNLGNVYQKEDRVADAEACFLRAIAINPSYPEAHVNLGNILKDRGEWEAAIAEYERAIDFRPAYAAALNNLGNALRSQRKLEEALPYFEQAVEADPDYAQARVNLGQVLLGIGARNEATKHFDRALEIDPEIPEARWALTFSQLALVHADDESQQDFRTAFAAALDELEAWIDDGRLDTAAAAVGTMQPFYLAYHEENNRDLFAQYGALCCRIMEKWQAAQVLPRLPLRKKTERIRLAICSAQIYDQSVWNAIVKGWCTQLDPERVELSVFHLGTHDDAETDIARAHSTHFAFGSRSFNSWVRDIHSHEADVIVYPEVGMDPMTLSLASLRLAPVQLASWGHPETTGLPTIDYYLSAAAFEPECGDEHYTERLVRLPHLGTFYSAHDVEPFDADFDALGIDSSVPRFVCPGAPFKYLPQHDHVFVDIARRVVDCQFVFFEYTREDLHRQLADRLRTAFESANLPFDDLVTFVPWLKRPVFYALLRNSDVYLDTIGFSGFNTAIQSIECGLPVVTKEGRFMRGRFASAILRRLGLDELVAASNAQYVDIAARLARDTADRRETRRRIASSRAILFRDEAPIRAFEEFLVRETRAL